MPLQLIFQILKKNTVTACAPATLEETEYYAYNGRIRSEDGEFEAITRYMQQSLLIFF